MPFETSRANQQAEEKLFQDLEDALTRANRAIAEESRRLCPVDTGALRDSIRVPRSVREGGAIVGAVEAGSAEIDYAYENEMLNQPFLRPVHYDVWTELKKTI